jgi:hypothetical protein
MTERFRDRNIRTPFHLARADPRLGIYFSVCKSFCQKSFTKGKEGNEGKPRNPLGQRVKIGERIPRKRSHIEPLNRSAAVCRVTGHQPQHAQGFQAAAAGLRHSRAPVAGFMGSPHGPLPRVGTRNPAIGAPGTIPASWRTVASNEPRRCSALRRPHLPSSIFHPPPLAVVSWLIAPKRSGGGSRGPFPVLCASVPQWFKIPAGGAVPGIPR